MQIIDEFSEHSWSHRVAYFSVIFDCTHYNLHKKLYREQQAIVIGDTCIYHFPILRDTVTKINQAGK